jgi:hypothetical protein
VSPDRRGACRRQQAHAHGTGHSEPSAHGGWGNSIRPPLRG